MGKTIAKKPAFERLASKRGKSRMTSRTSQKATKKPASKCATPYVPYVRHGNPTFRVRSDRTKWTMSLKELLSMSEEKVVKSLQKDGFLKDWTGKTCPRCSTGIMKKHSFDKYYCNNYKCKTRWLCTHAYHPIFATGNGQSYASVKDQASVLFCAVAGIAIAAACRLLKVNHKMAERIYASLDKCRQAFVEKEQTKIK